MDGFFYCGKCKDWYPFPCDEHSGRDSSILNSNYDQIQETTYEIGDRSGKNYLTL